ncbi:MAG: hypothetical protein ACRDF6_01170 [bacterium]
MRRMIPRWWAVLVFMLALRPRTPTGKRLFEAMDSKGEPYTQRRETAGSEDGADAAP